MYLHPKTWSLIITATVLFCTTLFSVVFGFVETYSFFVGFMIGVFLLVHRRCLLGAFLVWTFCGEYIKTTISMPYMNYYDELLKSMIIVVMIADTAIRHPSKKNIQTVIRHYMALLFIVAVSAVINHTSAIRVIHFFYSYLFYGILFIYVCDLREGFCLETIYKWIYAYVVFQFLLNLGWLWGINPLPNRMRGTVDFSIGLVASCNGVAYMTLFFLGLSWISALYYKGKMRLVFVCLFIVTLAQLAMTLTFHAYPLALFILIVSYVLLKGTQGKNDRRKNFSSLLIVLVGVAILVISYLFVQQRVFAFSSTMISRRVDEMLYGPKIQVAKAILRYLTGAVSTFAFGAGPGNFASSIGVIYGAPLARQYVWIYYTSMTGYAELISGSITQIPTTGIGAMISELGILGAGAFFIFFLTPLFRVVRLLFAKAYTGGQLCFAVVYVPFVLAILILNFLSDFFRQDYLMAIIWALGAYIWLPLRQENADKLE
jgi:hypothetical protein